MAQRAVVFGASALIAILFAGCGGSPGVSNTPDESAASSSSTAEESPTKEAASPTKEAAKVGDSITLKGNTDGSQISVVVLKVAPATSTDGFSTPAAGSKYVGVQFQITNSGTAAYEDAPSNGAKVADQEGQQFTSALLGSIDAGPLLPATVTLTPGNKALGYIAFEIPQASEVSAVQFSTDSGFGETGEWLVK